MDRNNLGRQTLNQFQQFRDRSSAYTFAEEFVVRRLRGSAIDATAKVAIATIQRLYSVLKDDPANEDESLFESGSSHTEPPGTAEKGEARNRRHESQAELTAQSISAGNLHGEGAGGHVSAPPFNCPPNPAPDPGPASSPPAAACSRLDLQTNR